MGKQTTIQRSWKRLLSSLAWGIALGVLSIAMFIFLVSGPITAGFAFIPAILSVFFFWKAFAATAQAPCPACGAIVSSLSTKSNEGVRCPGCKHYLGGKNGVLEVTEPGYIASRPVFEAPLGSEIVWPDMCCVCGKPATHREPTSVQIPAVAANAAVALASGGTVLRTEGGSRITVEVPHCDEHKRGASIRGSRPDNLHIAFCSYAYQRAFLERNGLRAT